MASPNMIAYQRYNALTMLMAGMKHGELTQGAPIGGMAAVMMYQSSDVYGRSRYNPVAMRAVVIDKLRERLLGLMFVPDEPRTAGEPATLDDMLTGRVKGRLYDAYRQSWVASPEPAYVAAGNGPLQCQFRSFRRCWIRRARRWTRMAKRCPPLPADWWTPSGRCSNRAAC